MLSSARISCMVYFGSVWFSSAACYDLDTSSLDIGAPKLRFARKLLQARLLPCLSVYSSLTSRFQPLPALCCLSGPCGQCPVNQGTPKGQMGKSLLSVSQRVQTASSILPHYRSLLLKIKGILHTVHQQFHLGDFPTSMSISRSVIYCNPYFHPMEPKTFPPHR